MWNGKYVIPRDIARIHRTFRGLFNPKLDTANRELVSVLLSLDNIYTTLHENRGLRENRFGNPAAIGECLRDYDREKRRFSPVERLYRQALRGQVTSVDIAQWIAGYRMAASERFIGLALNALRRGRHPDVFKDFLSRQTRQ